jgi:hypothetical protein
MEAPMVVKIRTPEGSELHEPPYTKEEIDDFYKRVGNGPVTVLRGADAQKGQKRAPVPEASTYTQAESSAEQAVSDRQTGSGDGIMDMMRRHNIPVTRENYLDFAYMGEPPQELSAEEEMNLPPELRKLKW